MHSISISDKANVCLLNQREADDFFEFTPSIPRNLGDGRQSHELNRRQMDKVMDDLEKAIESKPLESPERARLKGLSNILFPYLGFLTYDKLVVVER